MDAAAPSTLPAPAVLRVGAELRQLAILAVPLGLAQGGQALMSTIDTAVVGRVSATALGGVSLASGLFFSVSMLGVGTLMGIDPLISQAFGAGSPVKARRAFWQGVWLAVVVAAVLAVPLALSPLLLRPFGIGEELANEASRFLWWRLPSLLPMTLFYAQRSFLQAAKRPGILVWSVLIGNALNLGLDIVFVHGGGVLPAWTGPLQRIPAMGGAGAALCSDVCSALEVVILGWAIRRIPLPERPADLRALDRVQLRKATAIGLPIGLHLISEGGVFTLCGLLAGRLNPEAAASHQIALTYSSLTFCMALGFGNAGSVRVGWAVGARNTPAARRSGLVAFLGAVLFMSVTGVLFWLFPGALTGLMTNSAEVQAAAVPLMAVAAIFQLSDGIQATGAGVLRGAGDSRFTFIANLVGHYGVGLPIAIGLGLALGWGVIGLWWGLCAGLSTVAVAVFLRFYRLSSHTIVPVG